MLTITLMLTGDFIFGLSTESMRPQVTARKYLAESLAVQFSELASRQDQAAMKKAMKLLVDRNPEVLSTAVRRTGDTVLAEAGDHGRHWRGAPPTESTATHARVPIFDGARRWGTLELRFTDIAGTSFLGILSGPWFKLLCFMILAGSTAYFLYMRRALRHLDPMAVIPARVRAAFDVLAEGVAFVDTDGRIVLANSTFASMMDANAEQMMGVSLGNIGWKDALHTGKGSTMTPWANSIQTGLATTGSAMILETGSAGRREFMVNAAPILDDSKKARGAIVTFDDVTELEGKKHELEQVVSELLGSRDEIRRQNEKLEFLVTRDPMTHCLNRRSFMDVLEDEVERARRDGTELCCIMLDIDHFKNVNDTFGHAVGDSAIRFAAGMVSEVTRGFDIVCRYGGEEFCVLLPTADLDKAFEVSERIRTSIMDKSVTALPEIDGRGLTVSLGVSILADDIKSPMDLVDRADKALYVSKTTGRNRSSIADDKVIAAASVA